MYKYTSYCLHLHKSHISPINFDYPVNAEKPNFPEKVGFFHLFTLHKVKTNPTANPMGILGLFIPTLKVRKTPDFFRNPVFFMVAEAGLEPTTSGL